MRSVPSLCFSLGQKSAKKPVDFEQALLSVLQLYGQDDYPCGRVRSISRDDTGGILCLSGLPIKNCFLGAF